MLFGNALTGAAQGVNAMKTPALAITLLALIGSETAFAQQNNKPNVVFILADNVGYGDLGPYGGGELPHPVRR